MACDFIVMDRQLDAPRGAAPGGKLVYCDLDAGCSVITAPAPSLKLVLDGTQHYEIDGRTLSVSPGEFLYLDVGMPCVGSNRAAMKGICLLLPPTVAPPKEADAAAGHDPLLGRALVLSTKASAMGRALWDYGRRIANDPALGPLLAPELVARVEIAIAGPLAESRAAMDGVKAAKLSTRRELYRRLERARTFLHANDDRNVTLGEMAAIAGLSQFHLARYFRNAFDESPISYHRSLRLKRAAALLSGGASVAEAADATGYSDPVALSHAFRRKYGAPPHLWTRQRLAS